MVLSILLATNTGVKECTMHEYKTLVELMSVRCSRAEKTGGKGLISKNPRALLAFGSMAESG